MSETKAKIRQVEDLEAKLLEIDGKQDALVSGENIKTINNQSILGPGNIDIVGGESGGEANTASNLGGGIPVYDSKSGVDLRFRSLIPGTGIQINSSPGGATTISNTQTPGEANTASNIGTGTGLFSSKSGADLRFKSIQSGANVSLSEANNTITITAAPPGETNTASNVGGGTPIYDSKSGSDLRFRSLTAGTGISLSSSAGGATTITNTALGEVNNGLNRGATGEGIYTDKSGPSLRFKRLVGGANVTLTPTADTITIDASAAGEANTASNLGGGTPVFDSKSGADLRFRSLSAGTGISLSSSAGGATTITNSSPGEVNAGVNRGSGQGIYTDKSGANLRFKSLVAGTGVTLGSTADTITINSSGGSKWNPITGGVEYTGANSASNRFNHWNHGGYQGFVGPKGSNIAELGSYIVPGSWVSSGYQFFKKVIRGAADYSGTPTSYTILPHISADVVAIDNSAGYQQFFNTDGGGRTMVNAYDARVMHRAPGDMNGFFATVSVMGHNNMNAISGSWTGQPSGVVIAGAVFSNAAKTNVYGSEFQLYDNSFANVTGIGAVYGLYRTNTTAQYNHAWIGVRIQGNGSQFVNVGYQVSGKVSVGLDTTGMESDGSPAAITMARNQRLYIGADPTAWPNIRGSKTGPYLTSMFAGTVNLVGAMFISEQSLGLNGPITASSASGGSASALPSQPFTYIRIVIDGSNYKIPVYNN